LECLPEAVVVSVSSRSIAVDEKNVEHGGVGSERDEEVPDSFLFASTRM
jgi:hypothetical protein